MDVTVVDELNTIEATTVDLTVEVPNTSPSVDVTQQRLNTDVTLNNNQIVVEGGLTIENVNETFDVETNSVVITLDVVDPGSTVVVKESVLDVAVEAKTEIVEVLYGPGGGGITIADMNAIYAYAGADSANTVTNNRFFTNLFGWTISGGGTRLERTDPEVPANAPSQYVCKFGGEYARYTGKVLNVVNGERVYAEVSVATLAGGAPTISLKVFRYGPTGVKLGEETLDFANATSAWTRLAGFFETPNDGTTTVEFVLEISGANNTYDNTKRWYFTNGKLYSTASEEILSASIETINTILYDPIDGLTVQYSLALNNNGRITGIRANATGTETDFAILTDKFYVLDPSDNNNYEQVFEIVNGVVKLRELIANDITTTTITVKNNGQIKVQDSQMVPVDRVEIGKIGADYGLRVRNAAGDIIFNVDSLGANTVNSTQLVSGAVTPGKTNIAAINSGSGNLNSDVVDVANIINGAVTAAKTNLAAINSGTGNLNSNTVDTAQIIASAVTAAKTNLAAINSGTGNLNSNTVNTTQIIANAVTAAKTSLAAINSSTGNLNANTVDTAQIINGAISDAAKFSTSIRPVEVVATLPVTGNFTGRTVFLTTDQKLYRYNGSAYTASVPTTDLSGTIINGQIAANAVDATAIAAGAVTAVKTALAAINSSTGNLNANTVTATNIVAGTITTTQIAANTIVAGNIAAGTITTTQIAANTIVAGNIAANTITASQIAANTITAAQIAANTITAGQIAAGTITATEIAANTITASRLIITNTDNLIQDCDLLDANSWNFDAGWTINTADSLVSTNLQARAALKSANGNGTTTQADSAAFSRYFPIERNKSYRVSGRVGVTSGFTGRTQVIIQWFDRTYGYLSTSAILGTDYRTSAAGAITVQDIDGLGVAPSNAYYARYGAYTNRSTTLNNAGNAYFAFNWVQRAASGELIVDGAITAAKIAANTITAGQIAAGTITATQIASGTITATQIAAGTITASKLLITNSYNLIADADLQDANYWTLNPGWSINTSDSQVTTNLQARAAFKSPTGNGTTTQANAYANQFGFFTAEPNKKYRVSSITHVTSGFTGRANFGCYWYTQAGTFISATYITGTDYRSSAAGVATNGTIEGQITAPSNAYYGKFSATVDWSTTINNAGIAYFAFLQVNRANSGELIVDGTITAAKIQAGTITATEIAAGTITATQIAAGTITGDRIAANTITASKILLTDAVNMVRDSEYYEGSAMWNAPGGPITYVTSDALVTALKAIRVAKITGAGTGAPSIRYNYLEQYNINIEPTKSFHCAVDYAVTSGFNGFIYADVVWIDNVGGILGYSVFGSVDYLAAPAGSTITGSFSSIVTPFAGSVRAVYRTIVDWSSDYATRNKGGTAGFTRPYMRRAVNAELIVDGTITAAKIQANTITATQIAANTITAAQIAANSITASRLLITNSYNMIADADLRDASYWSIGSGWAINTADSIVTTNLQARAAWKSATGNGTTSQATTGYSSGQMQVEPGKTFRASIITAVSAGYTGMLYLFVNWLKRDGTASGVTPFNFTTTTSYKASAAGVITLQTLDVQYTAPSDAYYATIQVNSEWSTTLNNAGNAYVAFMQFNRAASGELIVDGSISAAKILANTITSNQIATDTIRSSDWNATTKQGWRLGTNGDIDASSISIWAPGVSPKKIFGASGMSYNGSNFYGLDQIITKINKASEDGSPDTQIFDGTNPDTWVDLCDLAITATGGQDIDIDVSTDMLIEQLFDPTVLIKYAVGSPEFRFRLRRTQGSTVDIKTSEWYKITSVGQVPAALFTVRDTTAVAGAATYLLQAQWRKGYYNTGTVSKSAVSETITGSGVSWLANIGASGSINEGGFPGIRASGSINFAGQPANGNTFTLNGTTVTFVTGTPTGNQVQIGINLNTTINNAVSFLNGSADAQISKCTYFNGGGTQIIIFYDVIGTAGNSFTLAEVGANTTVSGATLAGGQAAPSNPWEIKVASVDPNWWPINTITSRTGLTFNPDTSGYNALSLASLTNAAYEIRANFHAVIMRLKNYTIRTTEYRNTAVT